MKTKFCVSETIITAYGKICNLWETVVSNFETILSKKKKQILETKYCRCCVCTNNTIQNNGSWW